MVAVASPVANATNGYFTHGVGVQSQGLAGVGIALPQDGVAAATNPAGTARVGDRVDAGLVWFQPERGAEIAGNAYGADGRYDGNGANSFFIPEFGLAGAISKDVSAGLAIYGNGGMNTQYAKNPCGAFGGRGIAGVDLSQLFVTPSVAYKVLPHQSIGIGATLAYQRFSATGLQPFAGISLAPSDLTNRGHDSSVGWGVRLGWNGQVLPGPTFGATWASKIYAGRFDRYKGLFADAGTFDIPENFGAGIAWSPWSRWTLAADVQRINYSRIQSVGNPLSRLFSGNPLGSKNGPGFGWRDVTVYKAGTTFAVASGVVLRAGYSHDTQPIPDDQTFFNILAPGVVRNHAISHRRRAERRARSACRMRARASRLAI